MDNLINVVDWSRAQFALTAMYHWLFVPLTLGLSLIVAIMESIYLRNKSPRWLKITKFWMLLFGINFAVGVATGIILEFEFGSNWSNYSWFVGDIFGAPLAIEGLFAFFMESTFIAVMFFGWKRVSPKFHLAATWLTWLGASISALWILVANAWMQYPVGMEFDPAQMRNIMDNFWAVVFSPVAVHKFFHAVFSGWVLAGIFVIGVSCWFLFKGRNTVMAISSIKVAGWVAAIGMVFTIWTGDSSSVDVARVQPMKLAAMEGLYKGGNGQELVAFGILNPQKTPDNDVEPYLFKIGIPKGLSILAYHNPDAFVPGIDDLIEGRMLDDSGVPLPAVGYDERMAIGRDAHRALRDYDAAVAAGDTAAASEAALRIKQNYTWFGYGYLGSPLDAVPPVAITFYAFHTMVLTGGLLLIVVFLFLILAYKAPGVLRSRWMQWVGMLSIPMVWVCSQAGWVTAEVGRQPWIIQDILPCSAAISDIPTSSVQLTFWMFALVFTAFLAAEIRIMLRQISKGSKAEYTETPES